MRKVADEVKLGGYVAALEADDGEEQLVVTYSPSQSGSGPMMVTAMSIDGGCEVLIYRVHQTQWVKHSDFPNILRDVMTSWANPASKAEDDKVNGACAVILQHYGITR